MDEYIKRESVLKAIESVFAWNRSFGDLFDEVRDIPSEGVSQVRHGRWIPTKTQNGRDAWKCSACGEEWELLDVFEGETPADGGYRYCSTCGAKMDGEENV